MDFKINPSIDIAAAAKTFREKGRVQVPDILPPEQAEAIYQCLQNDVPWRYVMNDGETNHEFTQDDIKRLSNEQRTNMWNKIRAGARDGFQYHYWSYPMLDAYMQKRDPELLLHKYFEFINSPDTLDIIRQITGIDDIIKGDAQATWFGPDQFLTRHNDDPKKEFRRAAFVFNFTKNWLPDWGGYLLFFDESFNVTEGIKPSFNALNMFAVPAEHSVSYVPSFANGHRYGITGWFRYK